MVRTVSSQIKSENVFKIIKHKKHTDIILIEQVCGNQHTIL
jgi:hypothetical protein